MTNTDSANHKYVREDPDAYVFQDDARGESFIVLTNYDQVWALVPNGVDVSAHGAQGALVREFRRVLRQRDQLADVLLATLPFLTARRRRRSLSMPVYEQAAALLQDLGRELPPIPSWKGKQ